MSGTTGAHTLATHPRFRPSPQREGSQATGHHATNDPESDLLDHELQWRNLSPTLG